MTQELVQLAEEKLAEARCLLLSQQPAYGFAALKVQFHAVFDKTETACISINTQETRFDCFVNPQFIKEMTVSEVAFIITHELEHLIRAHLIRDNGDIDDPELMNIAADMTIHGHRANPKIGIRCSSGTAQIPHEDKLVWTPPNWQDNLTAEEYYRKLLTEKQKQQTTSQPFSNTAGQTSSNPAKGKPSSEQSYFPKGKVFDDHSFWGVDSASGLGEQLIQTLLNEVSQSISMGDLPGHWQTCIKSVTAPKLSWQALLRKYISDIYSRTQRPSILRRSRRHQWFGAPGRRRDESRHIAIVVDTSGSVSDNLLRRFFAEIDSATDHATLDLLLWDASFQGFFENYKARQWKDRVKLKGRGGTDMRAPVMWLQEKKVRATCYIVLTDGYCNWSEKIATPVIGVIPSGVYIIAPPHIRTVVIPQD
jgi:predicted metal-dependent peptidase